MLLDQRQPPIDANNQTASQVRAVRTSNLVIFDIVEIIEQFSAERCDCIELDRVTLKQDKTHCGRGVITYPIAHVVTDADADLEQNQPSGTESIGCTYL